MQLDNIIRLHALDVSENPIKLLQHFYDGKAINFYKEKREGKFINFSDKFLASELDKELPGVLDLYNFLCVFINLSSTHFKATHVESNNPKALFSIEIGNSNVLND